MPSGTDMASGGMPGEAGEKPPDLSAVAAG